MGSDDDLLLWVLPGGRDHGDQDWAGEGVRDWGAKKSSTPPRGIPSYAPSLQWEEHARPGPSPLAKSSMGSGGDGLGDWGVSA